MTTFGSAAVVRADARALPLPDASVDLIVTSPPYWGLRDYRDGDGSLQGQIGAEQTPAEYLANLWDCTREWMRVLKPSGSMWINLGDVYGRGSRSREARAQSLHDRRSRGAARGLLGDDLPAGTPPKSLIGLPWRFAIGCVDQLDLILRAEVIWSKPNALPESVTDRVRRSHEHWFHLTKEPRYYSAVDEIREPSRPRSGLMTWDQRKARGDAMKQGEQRGTFGSGMVGNLLGSLPGSVWEIATQPLTVPDRLGTDHYAAFPNALPTRITAGWCPPDGLVIDPFGGTGTTALAARALGRNAISFDLSGDYCRLAQWRTQDPGELARVLRKPKPPKQVDGQLGFDLEAS